MYARLVDHPQGLERHRKAIRDISEYCIIFIAGKQGGFGGTGKKFLALTPGKDSIEPLVFHVYTDKQPKRRKQIDWNAPGISPQDDGVIGR